MGSIFAKAPTCYFYDYEEGAWRWYWRRNTCMWAIALCRCSCVGRYQSWWLKTMEGCLELSCACIWWESAPPSWEEWEDERWYAWREWEKWRRQQVVAA
eukprot:s1887_g9.t1